MKVIKDENRLFEKVADMDANSIWHFGILTNTLKVESVDTVLPLFGETCLTNNPSLDKNIFLPYLQGPHERKLIMHLPTGKVLPVGDAHDSMCAAAKVGGTVLPQLSEEDYTKVLNICFSHGKTKRLILERYGLLEACHSDECNGYEIMKMTELLNITKQTLIRKFKKVIFLEGTNQIQLTTAVWEMPDEELNYVSTSSLFPEKLIPAVRFSSSDTSDSAATIQTLFRRENSSIYFLIGSPIKVEHKRKEKSGINRYNSAISGIYEKIKESQEQIDKLSKIKIAHPENVYVGFCKLAKIPKKYAEKGRETIEMIETNQLCCTAYELYLCLSLVLENTDKKIGLNTQFDLEEKVCSFINCDISNLDVGGIVAW